MSNFPDSEIISTSREHVFWTWSAQAKVTPIPVKRAEGVYIWDTDNNRYLDFNAMTMCVNIGHGNKNPCPSQQNGSRDHAGWHIAQGAFYVGWSGCQRKRGQTGPGLYRKTQNSDPLPLIPRCDCRSDGADRGPATLGLGTKSDGWRGPLFRPLQIPLDLPPHQP